MSGAICTQKQARTYLDVSVHKIFVHAMGSTCRSVCIPGVLEVIAASLQSLLEHHVVVGCVASMDCQIHLVVKHPTQAC